MKTLALSLLAALLAVAVPASVRSQSARVPRTPLEQLQAMSLENQKLLERQAETLKKLEQLDLEAQQLKFLGKRS